MKLDPVTLTGQQVRLEPLSVDHLPALCEVGLDEELWRWTTALVRTSDDMRRYLETALAARAAGNALPFAIVHLPSGRVVGSTRYGNVEPVHRRLEIGWSWVAGAWQRTAVNTECKFLLLRHAFEALRCLRVEFKTDALNQRSRAALLRLGAVEEGTLRRHMITESGRVRDTVYFSILDSEWPDVAARLQARLAARAAEVPSLSGSPGA